MTISVSGGTIVGITDEVPDSQDAAGFAALSYNLIGEVTDVGEFGREDALVTHGPLATRGMRKFKGSFNIGNLTLQMGLDHLDPGQALIAASLDSDEDRVIWIASATGDHFYLTGQVMSFKTGIGGGDQITGATAMIELTDEFMIAAADLPPGATFDFSNPENAILMGVI